MRLTNSPETLERVTAVVSRRYPDQPSAIGWDSEVGLWRVELATMSLLAVEQHPGDEGSGIALIGA